MTEVFIQSIADYNAGRIIGEWVDVSGMNTDDLWNAINEILAQSKEDNAEEWEIADYDGFYGLTPCSVEKIIELSQAITEHGAAYAIYASYVGESYASIEGFEDSYCGEWESFEDYAEQLFDECYLHEVPESIRFYIDYEAFTRDLAMDYHYDAESYGKVHVFRCI